MRSFMICTPQQYAGDHVKDSEIGGACGGEMHIEFWWENLKIRGHFLRPRHRWEESIKMLFKKWMGQD
jgi:hypothetical protein